MERATRAIVIGTLTAALGSTCLLATCAPRSDRAVFDPDVAPISLTDSERIAVAKYVFARTTGSTDGPALPERLRTDRAPRTAFITASDGRSRADVFQGSGHGLTPALDAALDSLRKSPVKPTWIAVDVVERITPSSLPVKGATKTAGLYGLVLVPGNVPLLPAEVLVARLLNKKGRLRPDAFDRVLERHHTQRPIGADPALAFRFTTSSVFAAKNEIRPLYRGHPLFAEATPAILLEAAVAGGGYLQRSVKDDGSFVYSYWPETDSVRSRYNTLRHAGTTYAMLQVVERTGDRELLAAAERALTKLRELIHPCPPPVRDESCLLDGGYAKLGGNGLAIVAIVKHMEVTGDRSNLPLVRSLGRYIVSLQQPSGEFWPHKQFPGDGTADPHVSIYYPGEALLGLMRLHRLDPSGPWLDTAVRGAHFLIEVRDAELNDDDLPHDHWLLYALNEIYRARPIPLLLNHAMAIARAIVRAQLLDPPYPDWRGGFDSPPRSTPTASRMEGLVAAYELARDFGTAEDAAAFLTAIDLGVRYTLQHQFRPEMVLYLPNPQRALGGFRRSYTNYEIRIDYVQHAISAILGYERILTRVRED